MIGDNNNDNDNDFVDGEDDLSMNINQYICTIVKLDNTRTYSRLSFRSHSKPWRIVNMLSATKLK